MQDLLHSSTATGPGAAPLQPAALAFDLDGTLIDTAPDIGAALNRALVGQGLNDALNPRLKGR